MKGMAGTANLSGRKEVLGRVCLPAAWVSFALFVAFSGLAQEK